VHARLETGLSPLRRKRVIRSSGDHRAARRDSDHLILPEGSVIKGSVIELRPHVDWAAMGSLRILFREVAPPNGIEQKVETNLEGVAVAKATLKARQ